MCVCVCVGGGGSLGLFLECDVLVSFILPFIAPFRSLTQRGEAEWFRGEKVGGMSQLPGPKFFRPHTLQATF